MLALKGVDLELMPGRVHALVGENGAGKSTLMKILAGAYAADDGVIRIFGREIDGGDPREAMAAGVAAIYQESNVVPALSALDNVFLGQTLHRRGFVARRQMRERFEQLEQRLDRRVPSGTPAGALSPGMQQTIEIMRALERQARVVIMDEPTAALLPEERESLFATIDLLRSDGVAIVFISHHLDEVLKVASRVTVLRDGEKVFEDETAAATVETLIESMLGERFEHLLQDADAHRRVPHGERRVILHATGIDVPGVLSDVSIDVAAGEIVGVAGLVGAGRTTLLRALAGAEPTSSGRMEIEGRQVPWPATPGEGLRLGIALAPEDRRAQGLVPALSGVENIALSSIDDVSRHGFVDRRAMRRRAAEIATAVGFDPARLDAPVGTLSGGNQQKIVLAKVLHARPSVLLVDEPVRGIDVGAKAEIFALLQGFADEGMAILMVSEEVEEMLALVNRCLVLCDGRVAADLPGPDIDDRDVLVHMFPPERNNDA